MTNLRRMFVCGLLLVSAAVAQTPITVATSNAQQAIPTNITTTGVTGTTQYCYWVVAKYTGGNAVPAGPACTYVANATLSASNFDTVNWLLPSSPLSAVTGFDILRTTTQTPPTGACACAVATGVSSSNVTQTDQANALNAYTVTSLAPVAVQLVGDNVSVSGQTQSKMLVNGANSVSFPANTGGIPVVIACGATSGATANCGNTASASTARIYFGSDTLASNSTVITLGTSYTSTTTYFCVANDVTTRANPVQAVPTSANTFTITNTTGASDVIQWICVGY